MLVPAGVPGPRRLIAGPVPSLSACALKCAMAWTNPWNPGAAGACLPIGNARESMKVRGFLRLDAQIGSGGVGFAVVSPCIANDQDYIYITDSDYTGTVSDNVSPLNNTTDLKNGVKAFPMANLPFSTSQIIIANPNNSSKEIQGRIVSVGMSAQYTGTTLNESGLFYCFSDPAHNDVCTYAPNELGSRVETDVSNVSRQKCWTIVHPLKEEEYKYDRTTEAEAYSSLINTTGTGQLNTNAGEVIILRPFSNGQLTCGDGTAATGTEGTCPMVVVFTGVPGQTVHIEVVSHLEYIGGAAQSMATPSVIDQTGFDHVRAAADRMPLLKQASPNKKAGSLFMDALKSVGKELQPVATSAILGALL